MILDTIQAHLYELEKSGLGDRITKIRAGTATYYEILHNAHPTVYTRAGAVERLFGHIFERDPRLQHDVFQIDVEKSRTSD